MIKKLQSFFLTTIPLCLTLLCFAVPAYSNGDAETKQNDLKQADLQAVIQNVEDRYKSLKDFHAHFIQLARILSYPEDQRSEGKVYLKRDRMMRWDYETPSKDQYYIHHDTVIFYNPDIKQARRVSVANREGIQSPLVFFEGLKSAEPDYVLSFNNDPIFDRSTRHILQLTPKDREKMPLLKILLFVDKSDYQVKRVDQYDLYGNVTELYFQDVKTNQKLPDSLFTFEAPKGGKIIDQQ